MSNAISNQNDNDPIKLFVHGKKGRMGSLIVKAIKANEYSFTNCMNIEDSNLVIDVTSPKGCEQLINKLSGQSLLIGTTGDLPMDLISEYSEKHSVAITTNFSSGVEIVKTGLKKILEELSDDWKVSIEGYHHKNKKILPSGTSKSLAEIIKESTGNFPDINSVCEGEKDTGGDHSIIICNGLETIELNHKISDRECMARGALEKSKQIMQYKKGLHFI